MHTVQSTCEKNCHDDVVLNSLLLGMCLMPRVMTGIWQHWATVLWCMIYLAEVFCLFVFLRMRKFAIEEYFIEFYFLFCFRLTFRHLVCRKLWFWFCSKTVLPVKSINMQASAHVIFQTKDVLQSNQKNVKIEIYNRNVDSIWAEAKRSWRKIRLNSRCLERL